MPCAYTNRFGTTYFLIQERTAGGKAKYFFKQQKREKMLAGLTDLPAGFEAFENCRGQVFLRKIGTAIIHPEEIATVEEHLKKLDKYNSFEPWPDKNSLTIFEIGREGADLFKMFKPWATQAEQEAYLRARGTRQAVMRFVLRDKEKRLFAPERYCFRGSVDDWISIGSPAALETLCKKFLLHLGEDSLYELYCF